MVGSLRVLTDRRGYSVVVRFYTRFSLNSTVHDKKPQESMTVSRTRPWIICRIIEYPDSCLLSTDQWG
jgi:hypothetical protein